MPANTGWTGEPGENRMAAQAQPQVQAATAPEPRARGDWEFLWRFVAFAMLIELGWAVWVAIQINAPPVILPAAYEAAAKARAAQNSGGRIGGQAAASSFEAGSAIPAAAVPASTPAVPAVPAATAVAPIEPPVNVDKLKFSESIELRIPERPARSARRREP